MKVLIGVGTLDSIPYRTMVPVWDSSSEGFPSMMSRCMEAVPCGGRLSKKSQVFFSDIRSSLTPCAFATCITSFKASSRSFRVSGKDRMMPMGTLVTAPTPLKAEINRNFSQTDFSISLLMFAFAPMQGEKAS